MDPSATHGDSHQQDYEIVSDGSSLLIAHTPERIIGSSKIGRVILNSLGFPILTL